MMMTQEAKILTAISIGTVILIIGAVFFLSKPEKTVTVDTTKLVRENSLKTSSASANLTIVEFGDYQCPACGLAHPGLKKAISDFPGRVNFVFRHFPLAQHKNAEIAAQAVEAANIQGKVWEMHDKLYESQPEWENEANAADPEKIREVLEADTSKEIKMVLVQHNETSTGVLNDIKAISAIVQKHGALCVVDAVSGFLAAPLEMESASAKSAVKYQF
jgi:protein-disulfide isomerase